MFINCTKLATLNINGFNTSKVTDMSSMFFNCSSLTALDLSGFNTSKVTDMSSMFNNCSSLTALDLSDFNTSQVTVMDSMFYNCSDLTTIFVSSDFNTNKVTDSANMFTGCTKLVGSAGTTYNSSYTDKTYTRIDGGTSKPGYFSALPVLKTGSQLNSIIGYDITKIIFGKYSDYSSAVSSVTPTPVDTKETGAYSLYKVGTVVYILTNSCDNFTANPDSSKFFYNPFGSLTSIENLNMLNTSKVTDMSDMFCLCGNLTSLDVSGFDTSKVTDMSDMFSYCRNLSSLDVSGFDTSKVTNMDHMFNACSSLTSLDVSGFDTSKVTDMDYMFYECSSLTSLDVSGFDTSKVTSMSYMFAKTYFDSLDLSNFNTSQVIFMSDMFVNCSSLTSLDLSSFDTSKVANMNYMFYNCSDLTTILVSHDFSTDTVIYSTNMFTGCTKLVGGAGTTYNSSKIDKTYARIDGGTSAPGYFTAIPVLKTGSQLNSIIGNDTTKIIFGKYSDYSSAVSSVSPIPVDTEETGVYSLYKVGTVVYILTNSGDTLTANYDSSRFFYNFRSLISIENLNMLDTSKVTDMSFMFSSCSALTSLDLSSFNTSQVTNMSDMFSSCTSLTSLDLSNFNTSNVINMSYMIYSCSNLKTIYASNSFNTNKVTGSMSMFSNCSNLVGGEGTTYNSSYTDKTYARIDGGASAPGYFTLKE